MTTNANHPGTQPHLDAIDPIVKTAVGAGESERPQVLVCCPLAIEFECVKDELKRLSREHDPLKRKLLLQKPDLAKFVPSVSRVSSIEGIDLPNLRCQIFTRTYFLIQSGLGRSTAENALRLAWNVEQVWLIGFAGGLDPSLKAGDTIEPKGVLRNGEMTGLSPVGLVENTRFLLTVEDSVTTPLKKAVLNEMFDCAAVDMEAKDLALACEFQGIPFHTARAISDGADEALPKELAAVILPSGDLSMMRLAWSVMKKPTLVVALYRLWKNSRKAKEGLRLITRRLVEKLA